MPSRRRIATDEGLTALRQWHLDPAAADRATTATAVRFALEELAAVAPGHSIEVRVPPFGVTQCGEGPRHTRGTPPNVVEAAPTVWLGLVTGDLVWSQTAAAGRIGASGGRADLSAWLPLVGPERLGTVGP